VEWLNPKTEIGRDGALRRDRAVQARNRPEARVSNSFCPLDVHPPQYCYGGRAGGESAARFPYHHFTRPTSVFGLNCSRDIHVALGRPLALGKRNLKVAATVRLLNSNPA
jgi:hypothetical protein